MKTIEFTWAQPIEDADAHNLPVVEVGPNNTIYTVSDGVVEETVRIVTTTVTTTITRKLSKIEDFRQQLLDRNIQTLTEKLHNFISPSTLRSVLQQNLYQFPPMAQCYDEYAAPRFAVYPSDETFCDWATDRAMREFWKHKFSEHYISLLADDPKVHGLMNSGGMTDSIADAADEIYNFIQEFADGPGLRELVDRPDLEIEQVGGALVPIYRKWITEKVRALRDQNSKFLSLDDEVENEEGRMVALIESGLFGYSDLEGRTIAADPSAGRSSQWNGYSSNDGFRFNAPKYDPLKSYREGSRVVYNGVTFVSTADFHQGKQPDLSPDFWEIERDAPPIAVPRGMRKKRRDGRLRPTPRHEACDRFLSVLLLNTEMRKADILRACSSPLGQKPFGRRMVESSLKRVGILEDGKWRLTLAAKIQGLKLFRLADPEYLAGVEAEERRERLNAWRKWAGDVRYEEVGGNIFDLDEDDSQPEPTDQELKALYVKVAKLVHPDHCSTGATRDEMEWRHVLTVRANLAYSKGGIRALEELTKILRLYSEYQAKQDAENQDWQEFREQAG